MSLPLAQPPKSICVLRLSAVGDICHTLPIVRTLQAAWPETRITWIIGKTEHGLVYDIPDIEFIVFDKKQGRHAYTQLQKALSGRRFDVLLHMQMALRASIASLLIKSPIRVGFDRRRAKDCQWLFTNHKIDYKPHQHVMESFFGFSEALGLEEGLVKWDIPVPPEAKQFAEEQLPGDTPTLVISPCSSMAYRNWLADGYAAVARYAVEKHGMRVVLSGGPSNIEQHYGEQITRMANKSLINLIGKTSLKQLLAILDQATVIISPDAGPAHMGTAVGTPVIGLYATTNPDRARPYLSRQYVINHYPQAVRDKFNKPVSEVPWGTRVRDAGTMERITVREVTAMLDRVILNSGRILAS